MASIREATRRLVDVTLRPGIVERAALRSAARRRRGIAVMWHRIGPLGPGLHEAIPTVARAAFAAQLDLLSELGDIVPLAELEKPTETERPRFALTFDDDDAGHTAHALPELLPRGLHATFFLSGRWCHRYGPYWWELLEDDVRRRGAEAVAAEYGLDGAFSVPGLVRALTGTAAATALAEKARVTGEPPMTHEDAVALAAAGMEIGFHSVDHPALTALDEPGLDQALAWGRDELSRDLGAPVLRFAYPHGLTDEGTQRATHLAGYVSAWTTAKRVVAPGASPMRLGRWDIGRLPLDRIRATLVRGLARPNQ